MRQGSITEFHTSLEPPNEYPQRSCCNAEKHKPYANGLRLPACVVKVPPTNQPRRVTFHLRPTYPPEVGGRPHRHEHAHGDEGRRHNDSQEEACRVHYRIHCMMHVNPNDLLFYARRLS